MMIEVYAPQHKRDTYASRFCLGSREECEQQPIKKFRREADYLSEICKTFLRRPA